MQQIIKATSKDITVGKDEIITVSVPSNATGYVICNCNGILYAAAIINGKAKVIIPYLPAGKYKATVKALSNGEYDESEPVTTAFTVSKSKAPIA